MNDLTLPQGLDAQEVYALLARLVDEYTAGGSSSVPLATANELLTGICYNLTTGAGTTDAFARFEFGAAVTADKARRAKRRYDYLMSQALDYGNITLHDTLKGLGAFSKLYNPRLFPLRIPADIDYQLSSPVPVELSGVDYMLEYLKRLTIEQRFTLRFRQSDVTALLHKYNPECDHLAINVFDMVFTNAIGITMSGNKPDKLLMTKPERERVVDLLYARPRDFISAQVARACDKLSRDINMLSSDCLWYFSLAVDSLSKRLYESLDYSTSGESCELFLTE